MAWLLDTSFAQKPPNGCFFFHRKPMLDSDVRMAKVPGPSTRSSCGAGIASLNLRGVTVVIAMFLELSATRAKQRSTKAAVASSRLAALQPSGWAVALAA